MGWTEKDLQDHLERLGMPKDSPRTPLKGPRQRMNKWEEAYDAELRVKWGNGIIQWYGFEAIKLRLADDTTFTPDFAVVEDGKLSFEEIKGFWREDALVKFKVAAEQFPFSFRAWRKRKVSDGGGWELVKSIKGVGRV